MVYYGQEETMERWGIFVKKHLIFLWTLGLLLACLIPMGASAEGESHEHTYRYRSNNDGTHTVTCTVEGCTLNTLNQTESCSGSPYIQNDDGSHSFLCAKCSTPCVTRCVFSTGSYVGEGKHSTVCVCGRVGNDTSCTPSAAATCTQASICSLCNGVLQGALGHDWGTPVPNQNGTHTRQCQRTGCGVSDSPESCNFSDFQHIDNSDQHKETCTKCNWQQTVDCVFSRIAHVTGEIQHTETCQYCEYSRKVNCCFTFFAPDTGAATHSKHCTSCNYKITENCTLGDTYTPIDGEEAHNRTCTVCTGIRKEGCTFESFTHIDNTDTHNKTCKFCQKVYTEACSGGTATCTAPASCALCSQPYGDIHHSGPLSYRSNSDGTHSILCTGCGSAIEPSVACSSTGGNLATCTKKAKCDLCEGSYGEPLGHLLGSNGCQRTNCDCTVDHDSLWVAGLSSVTCGECGKHFDATSVSSIAFTVTGYGYGLPKDGLRASTTTPGVQVDGVEALEISRSASSTFEAGKSYNILVSYSFLPGYIPESTVTTTINGRSAEGGSGTANAAFEMIYTITYNLGGGSHSNPTTYTPSQLPLTLTNPTKTGCTFNGWSGDTGVLDESSRIKEGTTGNLTFTANWKATVTFDKNGHGNETASQIVECGKKCPTPADPIDADYVFLGWYTEAACNNRYDFATPVTQNITLYAKWAEAYTLTFVGNGGTDFGSIQVEKNKTVDLTKYKPVRSGYWFYGWYRTEALKSTDRVSFLKMDGDKTVYAKWKKIDPTNPRTGDAQHPELAGGILVLSALGLGVAVTRRKRRKI